MNYKCRFCNATVSPSYDSGHIAAHFQKKEFTEQWLRKHFEECFDIIVGKGTPHQATLGIENTQN